MNIKISDFKNNIKWVDVENNKGLKVRFSTFGASVYSLSIDGTPLILTLKDPDFFLNCNQYYGKTLGRVAGRIPLTGELDGEEYSLLRTKDFEYTLHGGDDKSLSYKNWNVKVKELKNRIDVKFDIISKDKENGFPGKCHIFVIYSIYNDENNFKISFKASSNKTTLLNLSNHIYWNFNDLNLTNYSMKMNASKYGIVDKDVFITDIKEVPSYLDFNRMSKLGTKLDTIEKTPLGTIDNTFIYNEIETKKPQVILKNDEYKLSLYTDYPAMNIYVDNSLTNVDFINNDNFTIRRGIALEPQLNVHDSNSIILKKGDKYSYFILYKIRKIS